MRSIIRYIPLLVSAALLSSCSHYGYGVRVDALQQSQISPSASPEDTHNFVTWIRADIGGKEVSVGQLSHLSYFENPSALGDGIWRSSRMRFFIRADSGVELVPDSVQLYTSDDGGVFKEMRIESELAHCANTVGCNGSYTVRYGQRLPHQIRQTLIFTLRVDGVDTRVEQEFSLEYSRSGGFWDPFIGI